MSVILGIDPGTTESGWVKFDSAKWQLLSSGTDTNETVNEMLWFWSEGVPTPDGGGDVAVIERVDPRGMPLGNSTRDTIEWTGRFYESATGPSCSVYWMPRRDVKFQLCGTARAKDANVTAAVVNRFGGDMKAAKGTKKNPGPLYGIKGHEWQALAAVIAWLESRVEVRIEAGRSGS